MSDMVEATGLWQGKTKDGDIYYAGNMGKVRVLIFKNKHKKEDKHPDLNLYFAENKKQDGKAPSTQTKTMDEIAEDLNGGFDEGDNDIPF